MALEKSAHNNIQFLITIHVFIDTHETKRKESDKKWHISSNRQLRYWLYQRLNINNGGPHNDKSPVALMFLVVPSTCKTTRDKYTHAHTQFHMDYIVFHTHANKDIYTTYTLTD